MKKEKVRTFRSRLREDLKDIEFKSHYQEERQTLKLAMKIAKLHEKKGLSQQQMAKLMGTPASRRYRGSRVVSMKASCLRPWKRSLRQLGHGFGSSLLLHSQ
jgi:alkylated DNA nucleotide flippase Atl1